MLAGLFAGGNSVPAKTKRFKHPTEVAANAPFATHKENNEESLQLDDHARAMDL